MAEIAFIDSNIIIFANIKNSPDHAKSLALLEKALKGEFIGCINPIIAIEAHYKLMKYIDSSEAKYRINSLLDSFKLRFFSITKGTLKKGFDISDINKIATNDSIIIASMLENNVNKIYTDNEIDFKKYPKIKVVNPLK
ncbi:MAG: type II toxin-antitoxin system VapC family toxin [Candidatus Helarchaeota archaeon]|nr:type II toxin-antitoxin system VapC family toxin [Candidatus Helarchaeota archaeon]